MAEASPPTIPQLPLFPLQMVLFPGTRLPLQIFEVRYLDMISRCHREGQPFGVVALTEGREVQQPGDGPSGDGYANEAFHSVGTLARIERLERPRPGLLMIECLGTQRFRLDAFERLRHGLWVGDATVLSADTPIEPPDDLEPTALTLQALLQELKSDSGEPQLHDCGWVANRWAQLLPLQPAVKQRLLETDSPLLRLELVTDLLETLRPRQG